MGNVSRTEKENHKRVSSHFTLMWACFLWFVVWSLTNVVFLFRVSDSWIEARAIIDYLLWPLAWLLLWWKVFDIKSYDKTKIKSIFWNDALIVLILLFSWFWTIYSMKYEQEKALCKSTESTIENYLTCVWNAQDNILNLWKIFHD